MRHLRNVFHILLLLSSNVLLSRCSEWKAVFEPDAVTVQAGAIERVHLILSGLSDELIKNINDRDFVEIRSDHEALAIISNQDEIKFIEFDKVNRSYEVYFDVEGVFLGLTNIHVIVKAADNSTEQSSDSVDVTILRPLDKIFTYSLGVLLSLLYINFGAALNVTAVKDSLLLGALWLVCQFVFMPLAAYSLGHLLFNDSPAMALGLFFAGICPGGGASNMWTLLLGGNISLSIAMTTISTLAAFIMMPLWIFTLGSTIFAKANLGVPYGRIAIMAVGLLIPLTVGLIIQKFMPKTTKFLVRILKPLSLIFILFIIIVGIVTNLYIFQLFTWNIFIAGLGLPTFGYTFGFVAAKIFRQSTTDAIAIAIETGIQNAPIAIFLVTFALDQPMADFTTIVPISVALLTPFPLMTLYIIQRIRKLLIKKETKEVPIDAKESEMISLQRNNNLP